MKKTLLLVVLMFVAVGVSAQKKTGKTGGKSETTAIDSRAVDLGLSVKWATCNVGATRPEEYGLYFAWGETTGYTSDTNDGRVFDWANYKWGNGENIYHVFKSKVIKYCVHSENGTIDDKTTLDPEDDAAHINWGGVWRMPTRGELDELRTKCTWAWTTQNNVYGYRVTGPNGNSIFLPAAGHRTLNYLSLNGSHGCYGSSSLGKNYSNYTEKLGFTLSRVSCYGSDRAEGNSVRAVSP